MFFLLVTGADQGTAEKLEELLEELLPQGDCLVAVSRPEDIRDALAFAHYHAVIVDLDTSHTEQLRAIADGVLRNHARNPIPVVGLATPMTALDAPLLAGGAVHAAFAGPVAAERLSETVRRLCASPAGWEPTDRRANADDLAAPRTDQHPSL